MEIEEVLKIDMCEKRVCVKVELHVLWIYEMYAAEIW